MDEDTDSVSAVGAGDVGPDERARRVSRLLSLVLHGVALHSFLTGLGLLLQPVFLIDWAGWKPVTEPFFPAQGGVFHMLMAALYVKAALREETRPVLIPFIIIVKSVAAVFLLAYHFFFAPVWIVFLSGLADGAMAITVALLARAAGSFPPRRTRPIQHG
ncbi:MAG: hypothetical protein KFF77_08745 [Bacteroidetes bacterium]|nr:hypothetical protein [Bacteroidota bacterium]